VARAVPAAEADGVGCGTVPVGALAAILLAGLLH
jgi:hypothetical protein